MGGGERLSHCHFNPPQIPHGLACGEYSPPSASRTGGTFCVLLRQLLEELTASICVTHRKNFSASTCITYRRNLPPSASSAGRPLSASICITYGRSVLLLLLNLSEELTVYWGNLNAFIYTTYHSARTCQMLLQTLPEFAVPYSPCLQAIFVCLNCPM